MTSNLSVVRQLDKFIEESKARIPVLVNPPAYLQSVLPDVNELRNLLVELPGYCENYFVDEDTFNGYIEAIVMHPDFSNDNELDYRMAMFKTEPNASTDLALRGAMIVHQWMTT